MNNNNNNNAPQQPGQQGHPAPGVPPANVNHWAQTARNPDYSKPYPGWPENPSADPRLQPYAYPTVRPPVPYGPAYTNPAYIPNNLPPNPNVPGRVPPPGTLLGHNPSPVPSTSLVRPGQPPHSGLEQSFDAARKEAHEKSRNAYDAALKSSYAASAAKENLRSERNRANMNLVKEREKELKQRTAESDKANAEASAMDKAYAVTRRG